MIQSNENSSLEKKIKKSLYGKPQTIIALFPPGFGNTVLDEVQSILSQPWFPQKSPGEVALLDNEIRIHSIHLFAATELLMRSQCLSDLRLVIAQGKTVGKFSFEKKCRTIPWEFFLNQQMTLKIKVDSIASQAFHESALKEILSDIVKEHVHEVVSGEHTHETTTLYVQLYKNKLTISISLAGEPLYKRGYRGTLSASAPLREDIATCCIRKSLAFSQQPTLPQTLMIPFSGTGTFAFEYWQLYFNFSPVLLGRTYALQKMPFFRPENFNFLLKKARENCVLAKAKSPEEKTFPHFICIDSSASANTALLENRNAFKKAVMKNDFIMPDEGEYFSEKSGDFLEMDVDKLFFISDKAKHLSEKSDDHLESNNALEIDTQQLFHLQKNASNLFIPLNPPYGIRLRKHSDSIAFYKKIALKLNEIADIFRKNQKGVFGFILCPTEDTWAIFCKNILATKMETYHFTQGGLDIRVCQFVIK